MKNILIEVRVADNGNVYVRNNKNEIVRLNILASDLQAYWNLTRAGFPSERKVQEK